MVSSMEKSHFHVGIFNIILTISLSLSKTIWNSILCKFDFLKTNLSLEAHTHTVTLKYIFIYSRISSIAFVCYSKITRWAIFTLFIFYSYYLIWTTDGVNDEIKYIYIYIGILTYWHNDRWKIIFHTLCDVMLFDYIWIKLRQIEFQIYQLKYKWIFSRKENIRYIRAKLNIYFHVE